MTTGIIHRLGDVVVAGESGAFGVHPRFEFADQGGEVLLAQRQALVLRHTVEGPFDSEDRIDPAHRFQRQRRLGDIHQDEELALPWLQHAASVIGPGFRRGS